jgi:uncharacterized protein (AIM24 family)
MEHRILGTTLPVLEIQLATGESVEAVSGELSWMSQSIELSTTTGSSGGGLSGLFKRAVGGGSIFMTRYTAQGAPGMIAFATKLPGQILPVEVAAGTDYMVHRHGFLCATDGVQLSAGFQQSLGAGIFGGDGFILQKVSGTGQAWIELDGEVIPYTLSAGETLRFIRGMWACSTRASASRSRASRASPTCFSAGTAFSSPPSLVRAACGSSRCRSPTWRMRWLRICPDGPATRRKARRAARSWVRSCAG